MNGQKVSDIIYNAYDDVRVIINSDSTTRSLYDGEVYNMPQGMKNRKVLAWEIKDNAIILSCV